MLEASNNSELPVIPSKRYFTIGEVGELCDVKPHVLRYWSEEFPTLKPINRRGNRRYYQRHDVILIRQIRDLLMSRVTRLAAPDKNSLTLIMTRSRPVLIHNSLFSKRAQNWKRFYSS